MTQDLYSPLDFHGLSLKNRVAMAPLTRGRGNQDRAATDIMGDYYSERAGVGLIITEATAVSAQGYGWPSAPALYTEEHAATWKKVVDQVHEAGGLIFVQLWHMGRASHSSYHDGALPVAPSAIGISNDHVYNATGEKAPYETPRALTAEEIESIIEDYGKAAELAKQAGFDGVEIHSANGYLLDEFLQSKTNQRDDQYGGALDNRFRIHRGIIEAISKTYDRSRIGIRLSPNGVYNDMGSPDFRETFLYVAGELNKLKIGYLHVMDGLAFGFHELGDPITLDDTRSVFHGTVIGNCGYEKDSSNDAIVNGKADLIAIGRPLITNPDLVERWKNNWPLAPYEDMSKWYGGAAEGYSDYPAYESATV